MVRRRSRGCGGVHDFIAVCLPINRTVGTDWNSDDFSARKGEEAVDRDALLKALASFLKANKLNADWDGIEKAPNEALVNALAMMSPYGSAEKQAMLEAPDLKTRAEILVALTEIELAKNDENETKLQ